MPFANGANDIEAVNQLPQPAKLSDLSVLPAIYFKSDYSYDPTDYPLYAGTNVSIVYDLKRASCIPKDVHADSWTVTMSHVLNNNFDNTIQSQIAYGDVLSKPIYETPVIQLQQGDYQFWFQCSTGSGKITYDSQFGRNFHIGVYPPRHN